MGRFFVFFRSKGLFWSPWKDNTSIFLGRDALSLQRTFRRTPAMASPNKAFGADVPFNAERHAGSIGSFGVTNTPPRYTSGVNVPREGPIFIDRFWHCYVRLYGRLHCMIALYDCIVRLYCMIAFFFCVLTRFLFWQWRRERSRSFRWSCRR